MKAQAEGLEVVSVDCVEQSVSRVFDLVMTRGEHDTRKAPDACSADLSHPSPSLVSVELTGSLVEDLLAVITSKKQLRTASSS
jgi:hypothetical protein